jgi:predicted nucleic acid-binding Zn ribbon protein
MENNERNEERPSGQRTGESGSESRTTGSEGHSCRGCGKPIGGRRRNGFCSDRCRMRDRRALNAKRRRMMLSRLKEAVAAIEMEIGEEEAYFHGRSDED